MSPFATALKSLLDDTNLFNRKEWGQVLFLNKGEEKIEQWLKDEDIPRAHSIHMLITVLEHSSDVPQEPVDKFMEMAQLRATDVSPHGARMLPTVKEYTYRLTFCELSNKLAKLDKEEQAKLLLELYP
jgi:hypothetical protein